MIAKWSKSLIGKKVKLNGRTEIFTIAKSSNGTSYPSACIDLNGHPYGTYYLSELTLYAVSIDALKSELEECQNNAKLLEDKIAFLQANNLAEWDDDTFKAYQAIKLFNLAGDDAVEKAKKLIDIINK